MTNILTYHNGTYMLTNKPQDCDRTCDVCGKGYNDKDNINASFAGWPEWCDTCYESYEHMCEDNRIYQEQYDTATV